MTAFVLSSHHGTEHLIPLAQVLIKENILVFHGFEGLAAALAEDDQKRTLWIFDHSTFLVHANELARWAESVDLNICLRRRGSPQAIDATCTTLLEGGFAFRLWTLQRTGFTHDLAGAGSLEVQSLLPNETLDTDADRTKPRYQITENSLLLEPLDPASPTRSQKAQAFAVPPLVLAARRGAPLPDCAAAKPDEKDLVHTVWALRNADRDALRHESRPLEVLFCIPNGLGLGHLSRTLAVAQAMEQKLGLAPDQIGFWSYSLASTLIAEAGYRVTPRQTAKQLGIDAHKWAMWEGEDLRRYLAHRRPRRVIIDHSSLEKTIMDSLEDLPFPCQKFWLRRAFWRSSFPPPTFTQVSRFDAIITPGDLSGESDDGPLGAFAKSAFGTHSRHFDTPHFHAAPIVLGRQSRALPVPDAGLPWPLFRRRRCLVSLGGAGLLAYPDLISTLENAARANRVQLSWILPPLTPSQLQHRLDPAVSTVLPFLFPLAPYLASFDAMILGGGYNSCHEAMLMTDRPCLFVPREDPNKDDQVSRVGHLVEQNWAEQLSLSEPENWSDRLSSFFATVKSNPSSLRPNTANIPDGAEQVAHYLEGLRP
jgi:hypothetical protein